MVCSFHFQVSAFRFCNQNSERCKSAVSKFWIPTLCCLRNCCRIKIAICLVQLQTVFRTSKRCCCKSFHSTSAKVQKSFHKVKWMQFQSHFLLTCGATKKKILMPVFWILHFFPQFVIQKVNKIRRKSLAIIPLAQVFIHCVCHTLCKQVAASNSSSGLWIVVRILKVFETYNIWYMF